MTKNENGAADADDTRPLTEHRWLPTDNDHGEPRDADDQSAQTESGEREQGVRTERSDDNSSPQLTGSDNRDSTPREHGEPPASDSHGVHEGV